MMPRGACAAVWLTLTSTLRAVAVAGFAVADARCALIFAALRKTLHSPVPQPRSCVRDTFRANIIYLLELCL